jgi:hypothetical protein
MGGWDQNGSYADWLKDCRLDPAGSGYGPMASSCEYGDEPSGSGAAELVGIFLFRAYIHHVPKK